MRLRVCRGSSSSFELCFICRDMSGLDGDDLGNYVC